MMSNIYVSEKEVAFLALAARKALQNEKEALSRGEGYTHLSPPVQVASGMRVKLAFVDEEGTIRPEVTVVASNFTEDECLLAASEVLGGGAVDLKAVTEGRLPTYVFRKTP